MASKETKLINQLQMFFSMSKLMAGIYWDRIFITKMKKDSQCSKVITLKKNHQNNLKDKATHLSVLRTVFQTQKILFNKTKGMFR